MKFTQQQAKSAALPMLLLAMLLLCSPSGTAQPDLELETDTEEVEPPAKFIGQAGQQLEPDSVITEKLEAYPLQARRFDPKSMEDFKNDREFLYDRPPPNPGFIERFLSWLERNSNRSINNAFRFVFEYFRYVLLALVLVFAVVRLLNSEFSTLFVKPLPPPAPLAFDNLEENLHETDFGQLIAQAESNGLYRRAVRLQYLKTLKQLSNAGMIRWRADKTNADYRRELLGSPLAPGFGRLTYLFDHAWYGNFGISQPIYNSIKQHFTTFNGEIATSSKTKAGA